MVKNIYLGYNRITNQIYINDKGNMDSSKDIIGLGSSDEIKNIIDILSKKYPKRKSVLKTNFPDEMYSQLETLIGKSPDLNKMRIERNGII